MPDVMKVIQVHVPFSMLLGDFLDTVLKKSVNPEIGFDSFILDSTEKDQFRRVADRLNDAGLKITFHAPFMDLRPGAIDPRIRNVSRDRLMQVLDLVPLFDPRSIVCHPSFDPRYYVSTERKWLENSIRLWRSFADHLSDFETVIALENVYEQTPRQFVSLLKSISSSKIRFCFDTGHFNAFSTAPLDSWLEELGEFLCEVHLHDNEGGKDEHLPIGEGTFPFDHLFDFIRQKDPRPFLTLEAHSEEYFKKSFAALENNRLFGLLED